MSIASLESQPNFPIEDISERTAAVLEFWLQNKEIVASTHAQAELFNLYRFGHSALTLATRELLDDTQWAAFSYGIGAYETTAALVRPVFGNTVTPETATLHVATTQHELQRSFAETVTDAREAFAEQLPNTRYAIGESALRFYRYHTDYVIGGAAVARELEIGTLDA